MPYDICEDGKASSSARFSFSFYLSLSDIVKELYPSETQHEVLENCALT